jgi:protein-S-isoprenylcysteine O-methyltransferase Ste14
MSKQSYDHPNVIVSPPLIPIVTIAIGITLQWLRPLALLTHVGLAWRVVTGVALLVAGVFLASTGRYALVRRGTNVNPLHPATTLVTDGIFGWTRNPMYVGVSFAAIGIALVFAFDWLLLLFVGGLVLPTTASFCARSSTSSTSSVMSIAGTSPMSPASSG